MNEIYKQRVADIDEQLKRLNTKRREVLQEWVKKEHPVKVGEVVTVTGYSHKGKAMEVEKVFVGGHYRGWKWEARGRVLKKNGEPGQNRGEWSASIEEDTQ